MNRIAWLENKIAEAGQLLAADEERARRDPEDLGATLGLASMQAHINELRHELYLERSARAKEVVGLRLTGERLKFGSIPLPLLARIATTLNDALASLAWRAQHGSEPKRLPEDFVNGLDFRLADLTSGSTQLAIVGNTQPDLLGESPVESGLRTTFALLQAGPQEVAERAAEAGVRATRKITSLLSTLERERCGAELVWTDSRDEARRWKAGAADVARISSQLSALENRPPVELELLCEVELLAKSGRVGLRSLDDGVKISARYPRDLYGEVQNLHLGQRATFHLMLNRVYNEVTQQDVKSYTLLGSG